MICSHCGYSNDTSEHRCSRCGRPMQLRLGAYWRRSGLETDSMLASLPAGGLSEPPPPRQPLWKQELNKKLEGYRDRQKQGETERLATLAEAGARRSAPRAARTRRPDAWRLPPARAGGLSAYFRCGRGRWARPAREPKVDANWRRVELPAGAARNSRRFPSPPKPPRRPAKSQAAPAGPNHPARPSGAADQRRTGRFPPPRPLRRWRSAP